MVDTMVVGQVAGVEALAALGAVDFLMWVVTGISTGLTQGFSIQLSQYYGAKDFENLRKSLAHSYRLTAFIAAGVLILCQSFASLVLTGLHTPSNIIGMSLLYLRIIFCGIPATAAYNMFASALRAMGNSKTPLTAMIIASVLNVSLDILFVAGFTATNKLYGLLEMAAISYGYAIVTYVGQNLGAGKIDRIRFGKNILSLFISGEPQQTQEVLAIAFKYLSIMAAMLWVLYFLYVYRSALQGLGEASLPFCHYLNPPLLLLSQADKIICFATCLIWLEFYIQKCKIPFAFYTFADYYSQFSSISVFNLQNI